MTTSNSLGIKIDPPENGGRRLVITDIHGCAKTFKKLVRRVELTRNDHLFLLGDFINRGPRSKQVIDFVLKLEKEGYSVYCLMGNHEETILHIVDTKPDELKMLLETRNAMNLLNKRGNVRSRFFRFMRSLPYYYELDDYYLVHAGFNMKIKKPLTDKHAMAWVRSFSLKKKLNKKNVIFGHTPSKIAKIRRQIKNNTKSICLDNGCSHTYLGKEYSALLCFDLDSRELIKQKNID